MFPAVMGEVSTDYGQTPCIPTRMFSKALISSQPLRYERKTVKVWSQNDIFENLKGFVKQTTMVTFWVSTSV